MFGSTVSWLISTERKPGFKTYFNLFSGFEPNPTDSTLENKTKLGEPITVSLPKLKLKIPLILEHFIDKKKKITCNGILVSLLLPETTN